jgi:hypothetical protein
MFEYRMPQGQKVGKKRIKDPVPATQDDREFKVRIVERLS